jgi:hypothetical protein
MSTRPSKRVHLLLSAGGIRCLSYIGSSSSRRKDSRSRRSRRARPGPHRSALLLRRSSGRNAGSDAERRISATAARSSTHRSLRSADLACNGPARGPADRRAQSTAGKCRGEEGAVDDLDEPDLHRRSREPRHLPPRADAEGERLRHRVGCACLRLQYHASAGEKLIESGSRTIAEAEERRTEGLASPLFEGSDDDRAQKTAARLSSAATPTSRTTSRRSSSRSCVHTSVPEACFMCRSTERGPRDPNENFRPSGTRPRWSRWTRWGADRTLSELAHLVEEAYRDATVDR